MRKVLSILALSLFAALPAQAKGGGFGFNLGYGLPFVSQMGLNWMHDSGKWSAELTQQGISLNAGVASVSLSKPEINVKWHPFAGSLFVGLGLGQQSIKVVGTDALTSLTATAESSATTLALSAGWLWGISDAGFFAGMDFSYIQPSGASTTITAPGLTSADQAYQDAQEQAEKFGEAAYFNFTILRVGYLF